MAKIIEIQAMTSLEKQVYIDDQALMRAAGFSTEHSNSRRHLIISSQICVQSINEGVFTLQDLDAISFFNLIHLMSPSGMRGIKLGVLTLQDFVSRSSVELTYMCHPNVLQAIIDQTISKESMAQMSIGELTVLMMGEDLSSLDEDDDQDERLSAPAP